MPAIMPFLRKLSLAGAVLRLISLYGIYSGWRLVAVAWHDYYQISHEAGLTPQDVKALTRLGNGAWVAAWETFGITAALWAAAWFFDALKAGRHARYGVFPAAWLVGIFVLCAEGPAAFIPRTVLGSSLPVYFNYNSLAICAIAVCFMIAVMQASRLRQELERFV